MLSVCRRRKSSFGRELRKSHSSEFSPLAFDDEPGMIKCENEVAMQRCKVGRYLKEHVSWRLSAKRGPCSCRS